jgi:hypothetical protein
MAFAGHQAFLAFPTNVDLVDQQINLDNLLSSSNDLCWPFWPYSQPAINITTKLATDLGPVLAMFNLNTILLTGGSIVEAEKINHILSFFEE